MWGVAGLAPGGLAISKVLLRAAANEKVCNPVFHLSLNTAVPVPHKHLPGDAPATQLHLHATE